MQTLPDSKKKPDRRIQRTQQLLHDALVALILEKSYDEITVQDIIDRANVGRSTFYAHFLDKDHLLLSGFEKLQATFEEHYTTSEQHVPGNLTPGIEAGLLLFQHVQTYHALYKALLGKRGDELIRKQLYNYMTEIFQKHLHLEETKTARPTMPPSLTVHFAVNSLLGLLEWWLNNDLLYSPEQMNIWFHEVAIQPLIRN